MIIRIIYISLFFSLLIPGRALSGPLFPQDTIYACGTSYTLSALSGLTGYQWNTGATTSSITVTRSSWYSCSAIQNGTTVRDSVFLNLLYVHIINNDSTVCPNTSVTLYAQDLFNFSCTGYPSQNYSTWTNIAPLGIIYKCNGLYYIRTATDVLVGNSLNGPWTPLNLPGGLLAGPTELLGVDATGRLHVGTANNGNYVYNGSGWTPTGLSGFATGGQFFTLLSNGRIIITKTGSLTGIYYSNDNGNSWQLASAPAGTWLFITASDNGNLFAVGAGGAIRSTDGGLTWSLINNQLGGITSATGVTKDCNGVLWMAAGRTFYRSNDNGATWVPVGPIPSIFTTDPAGGTLLATSNGEIYYFGFTTTLPIVQGLFVTKDGGLTWTQVTSFPGTLSFLKEIDGQLIACTNSGIYALTLQPTLSYLWSTGATTPVTTVTPTQSTTYYVTVSNGISSCSDSVRISVRPPDTSVTIRSACDSFRWNGTLYNNSGTFIKTGFTNVAGCDSVAKLVLTINRGNFTAIPQAACDSFRWNNIVYTQSGRYPYPYVNSNGCPSADTLVLTINRGSYSKIIRSACDSYNWNNITYTQSGIYTRSYTNNAGCASIDSLILTVNNSSHVVFTQIACDSFRWNNILYTQSGTYLYNYTNAAGCSSVDTLKLTINNRSRLIINQSACNSYSWNGLVFNQTSSYTKTGLVNAAGCDSIVILNITIVSVNAGNDISVCKGASATLNASGALTYFWSPSAGLSDPNVQNPTAYPDTTTIYVVSSQIPTNNLIVNGDFSQGNSGFTSSYNYAFPNLVEGQYFVGPNAQLWNPGMASCGDHSTGSGNMLLVNGATTANVPVYCQTVAVQPNTNYAFSTWLVSFTVPVSQLQFSINGNLVGSIFSGSPTLCDWRRFYYIWNSGNNTTATICVVNQNTSAGGNDFGLDDIGFSELTTCSDSVKVTVKPVSLSSTGISVCSNALPYNWNGVNYTQTGSYTKTGLVNAAGCDSTAILNLSVNNISTSAITVSVCDSFRWNGVLYTQSGTYLNQYLNASGCPATDTLHATITPTNTNFFTVDTIAACGNSYLLSAPAGYNSYQWSTGAITQSILVNTGGWYACNVLQGACPANDSVFVSLLEANIINSDTAICRQDSITLAVGRAIHPNLIINGDFEQGNILFNTDYTNCTTLNCLIPLADYGYSVGPNPTFFHSAFVGLDHTTGTGNLLIVNGGRSDLVVWKQKISIQRNTLYSLEAWVSSMISSNTANLKFLINGVTISPDFAAPPTVNTWIRYKQTWFSGNVDTALIEIIDNYNVAGGNDFGLDDIRFSIADNSILWSTGDTIPAIKVSPSQTTTYYVTVSNGISSCRDSVTVYVNQPTASQTTLAVCDSLRWNGILYNASGQYTANLINAAGCDSVATLDLTVNTGTFSGITQLACDTFRWNGTLYTQSGTYTYSYNNNLGCPSLDSLYLNLSGGNNSATTQIACDTFRWNGTLYSQTGTYTYNYLNPAGCISTDTLHLTITNTLQNFLSPDTVSICGTSYLITAPSGYSSYQWNTRATSVSISATSTGWYSCNVIQSNCPLRDSVFVSLVTSNILNNDTAICIGNSLTLSSDTINSTALPNIILPPGANYEYQFSPVPSNWNTTTGGWNSGNAPFGNTTGGQFGYNTYWPIYNNLFVRTEIDLSNYDLNSITWNLGVDNGYELYVNGHLISSDFQQGFTFRWEYSGQIPSQYLNQGLNIIAVALVDQGGATAFDMEIDGNPFLFPSSLIWSTNDTTPIIAVAPTQTTTYYCTVNNGITSCLDSVKVIVNQPSTSLFGANSCDAFIWNGNLYTTSGIYSFTSTNAVGCDSISVLDLTINHRDTAIENISQCYNYSWNGSTYTQSGSYTKTGLINAAGCDSITILNLTIKDSSSSATTISACNSYTWNSSIYTQSGSYTKGGYINASGCDSSTILNLTINQGDFTNTSVAACVSYSWNGTTYTQSGTYSYVYLNGLGCTSADTIQLTISSGVPTAISPTACNSYSWNGNTYTQSGNYLFTTTVGSCTFTDTLHLTINTGNFNTIFDEACNSYTWNGNNYTQSGTYSFSYLNNLGCTSVDTLKLTIHSGTFTSTSETACDDFSWNGNNYTQSGIYSFNYSNNYGCASTDTLRLTINYGTFNTATQSACRSYLWNNNTYINSGTYWNNYVNNSGCASADSLYLTIFPGPTLGPDQNISICFGETTDLTGLFNTALYNTLWSFNQATIAAPQNVSQPGNYYLIATDNNGCKDSARVSLSVQPPVNANAGADRYEQTNAPFTLYGSGGSFCLWAPAAALNDPTSCNPQATISANTQFVLTVFDALGCPDTDTVLIRVLDGPAVYVPNAFTPNGDGLNDEFGPITVGITELEYFRIYNRYGELVFETSVPSDKWNGYYKGKLQDTGNFVWVAAAKDRNGIAIFKKGNVALIR